MPTKKIGYFLTIVGAIAFLASVLMDYVIPGDTGIGASQILGMTIGMTVLLLGMFLLFLYPNREFDIRSSVRSIAQRVLDLPVSVWVLVGFAIVYAAFYLSPVFFNAERSMWYFNRYIPDKNPIGIDLRDTMHSIEGWLMDGKSPYAGNVVAYPPLALALFSPFMLIGYPAYYFFITALTLFFHVGSALVVLLFSKKHQNISLSLFIFGLSFFSYGFQFELERGQFNIVAFSLCLIAIYVFHTHYEYRHAAYLLFTLGVQLKIYPAILIVTFVKDWQDWKANLKRFAGIGLLNLALLFVLGLPIFRDFLGAVAFKQSFASSWFGNPSLKAFVDQLVRDGFGLFPAETLTALQTYQGGIEIFFLVLTAVCVLSILAYEYVQNRSNPNPILILVCTICGLIIPSIGNDYKLPLLVAPIAAVFCGISLPEDRWKRILPILLILIMSMAYWSMQYPFSVKPGFLARNFPALFLLLVATTALNFVASTKPAALPAEQIES